MFCFALVLPSVLLTWLCSQCVMNTHRKFTGWEVGPLEKLTCCECPLGIWKIVSFCRCDDTASQDYLENMQLYDTQSFNWAAPSIIARSFGASTWWCFFELCGSVSWWGWVLNGNFTPDHNRQFLACPQSHHPKLLFWGPSNLSSEIPCWSQKRSVNPARFLHPVVTIAGMPTVSSRDGGCHGKSHSPNSS